MTSPRADIRRSKHGWRTFRIFAEALLRGGIKSIPIIGSGIDHAIFGFKDALSNTETKDLIQRIVSVVEQYDTPGGLSDKRIKKIMTEMINNPVVHDLVDRLEETNASTRMALAFLLAQLDTQEARDEETTIDIRVLAKAVDNAVDKLLEAIRHSRLAAASEYGQLQDSLDAVSRLLEHGTAPAGQSLSEIYCALNKLDTRLLRATAQAVRDGIHILSCGRTHSLTVDFAVMHQYAFSPFRRYTQDSFATQVLCLAERPLLILPGTAREFNAFLTRAYSQVLDRKRLRSILERRLASLLGPGFKGDVVSPDHRGGEPLALLADMTLQTNSPVQRLKRLFDLRRLAMWSGHIPPPEDLRMYLESAWSALSDVRPESPAANQIDAENLAFVAFHNDRAAHYDALMTHLTPATSMHKAVEKLRRVQGFRVEEGLPLTVDPSTWAFITYAATAGQDIKDARVLEACDVLGNIDRFKRKWLEILQEPLDRRIVDVPDELAAVRRALARLRNVVEPWYRIALQTEGRDLVPAGEFRGQTMWEDKLGTVQLRLISAILDLQAYIEPLVRSALPFFRLSDELMKS